MVKKNIYRSIIEIDLSKFERGLRREKVPVHRKSGVNYEYRRVGRKVKM